MESNQQRNLRSLAIVSFLLMSSSPTAGVQIRLVGSGSTLCSGRVEIYHNNIWGTVCDDNWDLNDAAVVCRELGCGTVLSAPGSAHFGQGTGHIWLDDVACSGSERSITECQHNGFGKHNCDRSEDAGVVCSVVLPKPSISMNPAVGVTWGHDISITCSISTQHLGGTFILQQTSGSFRKTQTSSTNSATFNILQVNFDNEGSYKCQYEKRVSGRDFRSPLSEYVRVSVTVVLPKPSISMNPAGVVTWRHDISITCSISTQHLGGTFILQQTSGSFRKTQTSSTNSATFNILQVNFDNEGSYQCQYEKRVSGRDFRSPLSDSVRISIIVPLQQPSISLTSPDGGMVWTLEGVEVTRGYSFVFTCSINSSYPGGVLSLIYSGSNITDTKPAVNHSASFHFPVAEYEHRGNYSCVYEVTLSTQRFSSVETTPISVIVKFPLLLAVYLVTAVSLLLLLLVLVVVVCLVRRRRIPAKQPRALVQTKLAVMVRNDYEDDEEDYVNVDSVDAKEKLTEEVGRVKEEESDDFEEPESDGDHDYEEAGPDVSFMNAKVCFSTVECKEEHQQMKEEEEETSDDENYYGNVTQPSGERTQNNCGEHEDIYQNF